MSGRSIRVLTPRSLGSVGCLRGSLLRASQGDSRRFQKLMLAYSCGELIDFRGCDFFSAA